MKISYDFFKSLQFLLTSSNWQEFLKNRLVEIDVKLATLQNINNEKAAKILEKIEILKKIKTPKNKETPEKITEQYNRFIEKSIPKSQENLLNEKSEIEKCLVNKTYKLGIKPFEKIETAKYLLGNIDVLQSETFNTDSVLAVKNMLRENFEILYDDAVFNAAIKDKTKYPETRDTILEKIINKEEITLEDYDIDTTDEEQKSYIKIANQEIKQLKLLDSNFVQEIAEIIKFISLFYNQHFYTSNFCIALASYFNNVKDVENFLKTVDFVNPPAIEGSIILISFDSIYLAELEPLERDIWHKLNGKFGKTSVKIFTKALDAKNAGIDIVELYQKNNADLDKTFSDLQILTENITFAGGELYPELTALYYEYNSPKYHFDKIVEEILPNVKKEDALPDININFTVKNKNFSFTKLPIGDLRAFFLGKMTHCCFAIENDAEQCVIDGFTKKDAGSYILADSKGKIIALTYGIIGNDNGKDALLLNSYEHLPAAKPLFIPLLKELANYIKSEDLMPVYIGRGGKTPYLQSKDRYELKPKDSSVWQHPNSKESIKVQENLELGVGSYTQLSSISCNSFEGLLSVNYFRSFDNLQTKYNDILKTLTSEDQDTIRNSSIVIDYLTSQNKIEFNEIIHILKQQHYLNFSFFSNSSDGILEVKSDIITKIFKKHQGQPSLISQALNQFSQIDKTIIEEVNVMKLLEMLDKNAASNWVCLSSNFASPNDQLNAIKNLLLPEENNVELVGNII